uniref:Uncharacterized protein n=1 Tax=Aegilops tauschii subsp. strangulata TaxID=200361 RepID=A0A453MYH1_AEGTS
WEAGMGFFAEGSSICRACTGQLGNGPVGVNRLICQTLSVI